MKKRYPPLTSSLSKSFVDQELIVEKVMFDEAKDEFYCSKTGWLITIQQLILTPRLDEYFDHFFDPMKTFIGIAVCWDCKENMVFSNPIPIHISKYNTRKIHEKLSCLISKPVVGTLMMHVFVWEEVVQLKIFLKNLSMIKKKKIEPDELKSNSDFIKKINKIRDDVLDVALMNNLVGCEIMRINCPSASLKNEPMTRKGKETLFCNTIIQIERWKN